METEVLNFNIGLSGTYWDKKPEYQIYVDDKCVLSGEITADSGVTEFFTFDAEVEVDAPHALKVRLCNKADSDVVVTNGEIEKDMLLNVDHIEIDGIELEFLKWKLSSYTPDVPKDGFPSNMHVNLGWNGVYELKFDSPFYIWALTNM